MWGLHCNLLVSDSKGRSDVKANMRAVYCSYLELSDMSRI
jgi:hypothetical protein